MQHGYVVGFDFGLKHIGVAVGQTITQTANGQTTISAKNGKPNWLKLDELLQQYRPVALVVGLPLNMDGSESDMSKQATAFAGKLASRIDTPVYLADERLSSWAVKDDDASGADIHARSACLIAETFLSNPLACAQVESG